jgi:opacity protein-like surface antigen
MKRFLPPLIAALAIFLATPALACSPYVGVHTGIAVADTRADLSGLKDGSASTGGLAGATLGFDCILGSKITAGGWLDGDLYRGAGGAPVVVGTTGAKLDHSFAVGGKLGYFVTPYSSAYAIGGYAWTWSDDLKAGGLAYAMPAMKGPLAGLGIDTRLSKDLHLDLQYRAVFLQDANLAAGPVTFSGVDHTVRVGLNFYFNGEAPGAPKVAP